MRRFLYAALLVWVAGALPAFAQARHVVVLYDERTSLPGLSLFDAALARELTSGSPDPVEVYREEMDLSRFGSDTYLLFLRDHLRAKYAGKKVDVAVAVMGPALSFLLRHGNAVFPGTPIVFSGIDRRELSGSPLPSGVTGIFLKREFAPTLEVALGLHPDTRQIVFVAGTSEFDRRVLELAKEELRVYEDRLAFRYLTSLPLRELLAELSRLPPRTLVLFSTLFQDGAGEPFVPHEAAERISKAANAPVYGFVDQFLGRGIVGGHLYSFDRHGEEAAHMVLRILAGAQPSEIPPVEPGAGATRFDWRQLQRWNIRESSLPPGSAVLFRQVSFWSEYQLYVLAAILVVALQTLMIGGLLLQRARRRRAESELRESESRFRTMADGAPVMIWVSGIDKLCTFFSKGWLDFTGRSLEEEMGNGWAFGVHPDDFGRCLEIYTRAFDARADFEMEYRLRRFDGEYRWIVDYGVPRIESDGAFSGYIGSCIDITERKAAETVLREVSGRLIHAQEQERARIARELHDDFGQRMALLQLGVERFAQDSAGLSADARQELRIIAEGAAQMSSDLHELSHKLHPSKLEVLGLMVAVRGFCRDFSEQHRLDVRFVDHNVPERVPKDVSLCIFRIAQEALRNVAKHSGATEAVVELSGQDGRVDLCVSDAGAGFDPDAAADETGLGLVSMRERLRLVGGQLSVHSEPTRGTRIHVSVPVQAAGADAADMVQAHKAGA